MAHVPLPGRADPDPRLTDGAAFHIDRLPDGPRGALATLTSAGHEAVLVGGCVRDLLRAAWPVDWDVATAASPQTVSQLFAGSRWENRFGTVTVDGDPPIEVTSYRRESDYRDRRRPAEVRFGGSLVDDLARRDFTINAVAWLPTDLAAGEGRLVDPFGGTADLHAGVIRAVGEPADRFGEDALRLLRAVRFSLRFGFVIEPRTEEALARAAPTTASLSGERVRDELLRLLEDPAVQPSLAFRRWESLGLLAVLMPELAALRGIPQGKPLAGDALDHSLRCADALPPEDSVLRLAGLLHDLGKARTQADGHFIGHETVGADLAQGVMRRLRFASAEIDRVGALVRQHMFGYEASWTDAAVRRFIRRVGGERLDDLFALRVADNLASGSGDPSASLDGLRRRIARQLQAPIEPRQLAIDGHDLQRELGLAPGHRIGELIARLMEAVLDDPSRNERETLLRLAREVAAEW